MGVLSYVYKMDQCYLAKCRLNEFSFRGKSKLDYRGLSSTLFQMGFWHLDSTIAKNRYLVCKLVKKLRNSRQKA